MKCEKHPEQMYSLGYCIRCRHEKMMKGEGVKTITEEEVEKWCEGTLSSHMLAYLTEILNGKYDLQEACEDILSFRKKEWRKI